MTDERCLVMFDTDRLKDYVFANDKLREVRGSSYLLTKLNECLSKQQAIKICPNCDPICIAGGSDALLVPSKDDAYKVKTAVKRHSVSQSQEYAYLLLRLRKRRDLESEWHWHH